MQRSKINNGYITFFRLTEWCELDKLKQGWRALGFGDYVPEPRAPLTCLKEALLEVVGDSKTLVRPLASKTGFSVVGESRGDEENQYQPIFNARLQPGMNEPIFSVANDITDQVLDAYRRHTGRISAQQLSGALVKVIYSLNGIRMRPSGGIYWLSDGQIDDWEVAGDIVANAAITTGFQQYVVKHEMTPKAVLAVRDGLVHDIQTRVKQLHDEIATGEMGPRGLEARQKEVLDLQRKTLDYEAMLDISLADLRKGLDDIGQAVASASMVLMCGTTSSSDQQGLVDAH